MKFQYALVAALGVLAGAGCGKQQSPPPPPAATASDSNSAPAQAQPASSQVQTQAPVAKPVSGNALTAPAEYVGNVINAQNIAVKTVDIASISSAIQQFNAGEGRYPKDLDELVAEHYLTKIPATPVGTKLDYDAKQGTIRVVRK